MPFAEKSHPSYPPETRASDSPVDNWCGKLIFSPRRPDRTDGWGIVQGNPIKRPLPVLGVTANLLPIANDVFREVLGSVNMTHDASGA